MLQSQGKAAFLEGSAPLGPVMRGAGIHRQREDGGELCSFYDFKIETPAGPGRSRWPSGTRSVTAGSPRPASSSAPRRWPRWLAATGYLLQAEPDTTRAGATGDGRHD